MSLLYALLLFVAWLYISLMGYLLCILTFSLVRELFYP